MKTFVVALCFAFSSLAWGSSSVMTCPNTVADAVLWGPPTKAHPPDIKYNYTADGFYRVAAVTPHMYAANPTKNAREIVKWAKQTAANGAALTIFPEESLHGYFIDDIKKHELVRRRSLEGLEYILEQSKNIDTAILVGSRFFSLDTKPYNTMFVIYKGKIHGAVPKEKLPSTGEFYEGRYVASADKSRPGEIFVPGHPDLGTFPFAQKLIFYIGEFSFSLEVCEDGWGTDAPGDSHAHGGALFIANSSASNELRGKRGFRINMFGVRSALAHSGIGYTSEGPTGETTRMVAGAHRMIFDNGKAIAEAMPLTDPPPDRSGVTYGEIDVHALMFDRGNDANFMQTMTPEGYQHLLLSHDAPVLEDLTRKIDPYPFLDKTQEEADRSTDETIAIQREAIVTRFKQMGATRFVFGLSGGKDSGAVCIAIAAACDEMGLDRSIVTAMNLRGPGNDERSIDNSEAMARGFGFTFVKQDIRAAVNLELVSLGQSIDDDSSTLFDNVQARIRINRLLNETNRPGGLGLLIATGNMTEAMVGWNTWGDEKGFNPNQSMPKTFMPMYMESYARRFTTGDFQAALLYTAGLEPSPGLKILREGHFHSTTQLVGSADLNDFFTFQVLRHGSRPRKIFQLAKLAFSGVKKADGTPAFSENQIYKSIVRFFSRVFSQQFKRTVFPAGVMTGTLTPDPRGTMRWPDLIDAEDYMDELEFYKPVGYVDPDLKPVTVWFRFRFRFRFREDLLIDRRLLRAGLAGRSQRQFHSAPGNLR